MRMSLSSAMASLATFSACAQAAATLLWHPSRHCIHTYAAAACGESEPTVLNAIARARNMPLWRRKRYMNITLGPGGPLPWPLLSNTWNDLRQLCMRSWRGSFRDGNAVGFELCPHAQQPREEQVHRWAKVGLFAWDVRSVVSTATSGTEQSSRNVVRIVPRAAPHLCLTAPPLLSS